MQVFEESVTKHGVIGGLFDDSGNGREADLLRRPETTLTHNQLIVGRSGDGAHHDGLQNTNLTDAVHELGQILRVEHLTWLLRVGNNQFGRDEGQARAGALADRLNLLPDGNIKVLVEGIDRASEARDMEFYDTQYTLLKAESLAERVGMSLKLHEQEAFFEAHGVDGAERVEVRKRQVMSLLLKNVTIEPVKKSKLVNVKYTSRSPELSSRIADAWGIPQERAARL